MIHRSFFYLFSLIAAGMLLVACGGAEPAPTPTATPQPAQPTFTPTTAPQAPAATLATPAAAQTPSAPAAFALPAPLYYIDRASGQIMRMERDATTVTQLTNEGASITAFDVAPVSGDLVYVTNNSLVQTDARGGNRVVKLQGPSLIDDGSPNPFPGVFVRAPRFSPDGQSIVFGLGNLYLMAAGPTTDYQILIPAAVQESWTQEFWPASWSPDGQRLLVFGSTVGGPPVSFLYTLAAGTTLPLQSPIQDHIVWGADGRALYASGASLGFIYDLEPGLAHIDAASGAVTKLLRHESLAAGASGTLAAAVYAGEDGRLQAYTAVFTNPASWENPPPLPPFALHIVDTATGALTPLVAPPLTPEQLSSVAWAPGGAGLVYLDQMEAIPVPGGALQGGQLFWAGVGENSSRPLGVAGSAPQWLQETYSPFLTPIVVGAAAVSPPQPAAPQPAAPANVPDRIVDNRDPAVEKNGDWYTNSGGQDYGGDCLWTPPNGGYLIVRPGLPVAGYYTLAAWSCGDPNGDHAPSSMALLASEGDLLQNTPEWTPDFLVDPNQAVGQWQELGTYFLKPDAYLVVHASQSGNAIFDAVRFSYQPGQSGPVPVPTPTPRVSNQPPSPLEQLVLGDFRRRLNRFNSSPQLNFESTTFDDCATFPRPDCGGQRAGRRVVVTHQGLQLVYRVSEDLQLINLEPNPALRELQWLYLVVGSTPSDQLHAYRYAGADGSWRLFSVDASSPRGGAPAGPADGARLEQLADRYGIVQTPEFKLFGRGQEMLVSQEDRAWILNLLTTMPEG